MDTPVLRPGTRLPDQPADPLASEFEGVIGGSDTIDPQTSEPDPTDSYGRSSQQVRDMQAAMAAEAERTCEYCIECGFLAGNIAWAAFPFRPAMDYQHRVSSMLGGGAPILNFEPHVPRIQEWALADANSGNGRRNFDGFNQALCLLIEAKLGYADYMQNSVSRLPILNGDGATVPVYRTMRDPVALGRMTMVFNQMRNHHVLASRYPFRRQGWQFFTMFCGVAAIIS